MVTIIDGKKIAYEILSDLRLKLKALSFQPRLIVILVGQNPASVAYIKMKKKRGEEIGLTVQVENYPDTISEGDLRKEIQSFNSQKDVCGILVQLPLPGHLDKRVILDTVLPELDVDSLTSVNKQSLLSGSSFFSPPAAAAIIKILEYYKIDLARSKILTIGTGDLVGKPLGAIFRGRNLSFESADSDTKDLQNLSLQADIIITGVGKPNLVTGDMVKEGAVVIDAGTTGSDTGDIVGDIDFESVSKKASFVAGVPGGVGPVTIAMLFQNVVQSAMRRSARI